jgi:hypothetical protein
LSDFFLIKKAANSNIDRESIMKNIFKMHNVRSIVCFSLVTTLSGCSLISDFPSLSFGDDEVDSPKQSMPSYNVNASSETLPSVTKTQENKYEAHLAEWQQAKANVNKVANLAGQLTALTAKVKSLESTQAKLAQQLNSANKSSAQPADYSNSSQSSVNTMKGYAIQLFSVPQKSQIQPSWDKSMKMHPSELSGLKRIYEEVTVSNRLYYRVKAGVFNSKLQAEQLCSKIKSSGAVCIPTLFKGQPF